MMRGARALNTLHWWIKTAIALCIAWLWLSPAAMAAIVRIAIARNAETLTIGSSTAAKLGDRQGQILQDLAAEETTEIAIADGKLSAGKAIDATQLVLQPNDPDGFVYINDRAYRGSLSLFPSASGILAVNYVELGPYVSSVVGGEVGSGFEFEAMKAQAVASRTYVLHHQQRRLGDRYDIGSTAAAQVYRGVADESSDTWAAARDTEREVLTYEGRLIDAVFHASSGGATENAEDIWGFALPYLRSVKDNWQEALQPWTETIPLASLADFLRDANLGDLGEIEGLTVSSKTATGRATAIALQGEKGNKVVPADEFAHHFNLKSTFFSLDAQPEKVVIAGTGWGHGVGMSQWGAFGLAKQGWTYRQILAYYFQGVGLTEISQP